MAAVAICIAAFAMSAAAQTVTSSGAMGTVNNVPYISAATSTSTTPGVSLITITGGNVGVGTKTLFTAQRYATFGIGTSGNVYTLNRGFDDRLRRSCEFDIGSGVTL
jgi:hypothetical protein